ncbi:M28 family peptidase, partial [Candidatus Bathyarchaeota archaeon]|nr:M28 family peptidase [Candidatus Bathyarchaeota archaeon]
NRTNISAEVVISSLIGSGVHYNVVGRLPGTGDPEKLLVISAHYDTVMDAGFVDNGAGTAGVLELVRIFTYAAQEGIYNSNCTIVFVVFGDEELGLV